MATEDARYRLSTQYRLWSFSPSKLAELREQTNSLARTHITSRLIETKRVDTEVESLPEFLTPAEETQLLKVFTVDLIRAADFCGLPTEVRATATVFLRRFYVTNSIMTYPPQDVLKTCLFFGSKAEGLYTRLAKLAEKFPNTTEEEILAGEFLLCQGVRFAFDVRHPFRALEGAILELRRHADLEKGRIDSAHFRARAILKFSSLVTDAYFHYTPSQIMLAALSLADRGLAERLVQGAFSHSQNGTPNEDGVDSTPRHDLRDKVMGAIESCRELLATEPPERLDEYWGTPESTKLIKPLLRKLKKCRDPDRADLVALQKARRELASQKDSRRPKAEGDGALFGGDGGALGGNDARDAKRRKVTENDDVFGPALG
ncbi:cyclin CCL1 [Colletotrichum tofieldiae]|uniref:Cyclin CCL1 n=2 Tax=Colletotrichum spaethianum species complex TaxID=2707349 RepID=A0A166NSZ3_9PEZI|nr:Cyclin CCL1 [Colletotrichum tofieldiae]GJC90934.1 cyclin CCL1 [Colletotrichum liriopes]GKT67135.1 cyclin CCL1 [Colletotrichum tofieldiae]GKT80271.1 cyclin CCL1 [Colletotrichum tofieldiae]